MLSKQLKILLFFGFCFALGFSQAQNKDAVVKNLRIELQPNTVVVRYSVDYAGLVELYLKNPKNVYILKTGKVSEIGENEIKISRKKLKPGAEYTIEIEYKGKELIRKFVN